MTMYVFIKLALWCKSWHESKSIINKIAESKDIKDKK